MEEYIGAMIIAASVLAAWRRFFSSDTRTLRRLRRITKTALDSVAEGQVVTLVGKLRYDGGQSPLRSPLTQRECVYYQSIVQKRELNAAGIGPYKFTTLATEEETVETFWLEVGSSRAMVDLRAATVLLHMDRHNETGGITSPTPGQQQFLDKHGISGEGLIFNRALRFKEGVLQEGEPVLVHGQGSWQLDPGDHYAPLGRRAAVHANAVPNLRGPSSRPSPGAGGGYREPPKRLCIVPTSEGKLLVSDDPRAVEK